MASADPETRTRVARSGGAGRAAALTAGEREAIARKGANATNHPEALARRIVKAWPTLNAQERREVRDILAALH